MEPVDPVGPATHFHPSSVVASPQRKPRTTDTPTTTTEARDARDAAVKATKQYLLEVVRDDWFDAPWPSASHAVPPQRLREIKAWREREQDSSCSENERGHNGYSVIPRMKPDPYRFESPDAVEVSLLERRRKRRKLILDEVQWNDGLRTWLERRDAWTGAAVPHHLPLEEYAEGPMNIKVTSLRRSQKTSSDGSGVGSYSGSEDADIIVPGSRCSSRPLSSSSIQGSPGYTSRVRPILPAIHSPPWDGSLEDTPVTPFLPRDTYSVDEPMVPIVSPLLPKTNPMRASIKPSVYPSIYSKVVIQALTPTIPINLSDVTKALVQGWKADGEWPPKPTVNQDVPIVKKRSGNVAPEESGKGKKITGSGVSRAVRKVLGLSSIHSGHRFHISSSSQSGATLTHADEQKGKKLEDHRIDGEG